MGRADGGSARRRRAGAGVGGARSDSGTGRVGDDEEVRRRWLGEAKLAAVTQQGKEGPEVAARGLLHGATCENERTRGKILIFVAICIGVSEVGLNIREAHVYSTVDGFSLSVFLVDGWYEEEAGGLLRTIKEVMA
uniref:Uncharacterized protein n=1 Tax=Oryza punctata TaxID=4537 RepID=A0A0E0LQC1_ORYPU